MTLEKAELKAAFAHDMGCKFDDVLAEEESELHRNEGAAVSLLQAAEVIGSLIAKVDKELDAKDIDIPTAKKVKEYVNQAAMVLKSLSTRADQARVKSIGKIEAMKNVVALTQKTYEGELQKAKRIKEAEDEGFDHPSGRPPGVHPGQSLKQKRQAEEAAEASKKATKKKTTKKAPARKPRSNAKNAR